MGADSSAESEGDEFSLSDLDEIAEELLSLVDLARGNGPQRERSDSDTKDAEECPDLQVDGSEDDCEV